MVKGNNMATFNVRISTRVTKTAEVEVNIKRQRLVDEGLLNPGDNWRDEAESYIYMNIDELIDNGEAKINGAPFDPCSDQWDYEEDGIECDDVRQWD